MKKLTKVAVSAAIMASAFAMSVSADGGKVYYLNFAPEVADQWEALAEKYSEETGTEVQKMPLSHRLLVFQEVT